MEAKNRRGEMCLLTFLSVAFNQLFFQQMERFKVCEKETKTKAFSKEGLAAASRKDHKDSAAKMELYEWIEVIWLHLVLPFGACVLTSSSFPGNSKQVEGSVGSV